MTDAPNLQNRLVFPTGQNESKECCAMIKTDGNLNISAESRLIYIGNWVFQLFQIISHKSGNGKCQKSGLDWLQTANFAGFSIFSPKIRLRLTWNGQFHPIHNLLPPKHHFLRNLKTSGVHQQIFWVSQLFQIISHQRAQNLTMANFAKKVA